MIPVQLTIKGLYSYAKAETIDFEPLVKAKLFGIFGPVGSGKSAILEAIMFVLFDRSTRLNKVGDDRYYNMMNLQSNEMIIDFIFKGGTNHRTKYRFYFMARRSTKEFKKVDVKDRSYYKWSKNDWVPMNKPEGLGMTYDNFMQTVIIPQGKFRDFIDQKPKDRTQMLKELFHLDRFDIASQAFGKLGTLKEQCKFLDGQLSQYLEISKVLIKQLEKEISQMIVERDKMTLREVKVGERVSDMQLLQHQHNELQDVSRALSVLESETTFFKNKQAQLTKYLKVQDLFRDKISQQQKLLLKAKTKEHELSNLLESIGKLEKEAVSVRMKWEEAKRAFDRKENVLRQIEDLQLLIRLKAQTVTIESTSNTLIEEKQRAKMLEQDIALLDQEITDLQIASSKKGEAISNLSQLSDLNDWWDNSSEKRQKLKVLTDEQSILEKEILAYKKQQDAIKSKRSNQSELRKQILKAEEAVQGLKLAADWSIHAQHLKEGKPCPLCGATSHPKPTMLKGLDSKLEKARARVVKLELELEVQRQLEQNLEIIVVQLNGKKDVLITQKQKREEISQELHQHLKKYPGEKIPNRKPSNLVQRMATAQQLIEETEKSLTDFDAKIARRQVLRSNQQKTSESS